MKVYISADIEGITGIADWEETENGKSDYIPFAEQMNKEVKAACEAAVNAGATEIWIKDAHGLGRNIELREFPKSVKLIRGWSGHPFNMMQEIDDSFTAAIMIGYHSGAGTNGNPLSHTLDLANINYIKINDEITDEFLVNAYTAAYVNVPVVFVSGDEELCKTAKALNSNIETMAVNKGIGNSVLSIHPEVAIEKTKERVEAALRYNIHQCSIKLPSRFKIEIAYTHHKNAYKASFYPGVKQIAPNNIIYETNNYFDALTMFSFVL